MKDIKKMIKNEKICQHSPYYLLRDIFSDGVNTYFDYPEDLKKIDALRSIFENGIWSPEKMSRHKESGGHNIKGGRGYGPEAQSRQARVIGTTLIKTILNYLERKKIEGIKSENINYDAMIADKEFVNSFLSSLDDIKSSGRPYSYNKQTVIEDWLNSSTRTKVVFRRLKQANWQKTWSKKDDLPQFHNSEESKNHFKFYHLLSIFYGRNLISSIAPEYIKKTYNEIGEIKKGEYDVMSILFKKPKKIHTHSIIKKYDYDNSKFIPYDIGIANKVSIKDFVAVVINKEIKELPKEVLNVIPKNLPIITTDFKVIRMPEIVNNKEKNE